MSLLETEFAARGGQHPAARPTEQFNTSFETSSARIAPYLMSVRKAAEYLGRTEKAVRHMYERRVLTPLRIDGRVFLDRREIDALYERARAEAV
jgi:hypothetical protein